MSIQTVYAMFRLTQNLRVNHSLLGLGLDILCQCPITRYTNLCPETHFFQQCQNSSTNTCYGHVTITGRKFADLLYTQGPM